MRHANNRQYRELLERVRQGVVSDNDLDLLNTRVDWNINEPFLTLGMFITYNIT